jgi:hypothetical protein
MFNSDFVVLVFLFMICQFSLLLGLICILGLFVNVLIVIMYVLTIVVHRHFDSPTYRVRRRKLSSWVC